jgi:2',3'-cyclic-nucleotide 2'-phosphodiesterase (5'-nucleotidase family)
MKSTLFYIYIISLLLISVYNLKEEEIIDLDPQSEVPDPNDPEILYIPIIQTNDIHGSFYPKKILLPSGGIYYIGGLEYLGKYISIMSETWGDRLLYFDTGDQFQGGIEGYISQGQIMMDFFNELEVEKSIIGNHEFDYGVPFLKKYMNRSNFDWIIDNVRNTTSGQYITFPHQKKSTIIEIGGIKLGLIGITTVETPTSTNVALPDLKFEEYKKIIEEESKKLKNEGANAIIVLGHVGLYCNNDLDEVKLEYKIRNKDLKQEDCRNTDEAYILLNKLNKGVIDLFLGGHKHDVSHHWINDIPIVTNDKNGKYAQIIYLPFNRNTHELISDKILFEGPLPICDKLFKNKKLCDLSVVTEQDEKAFGELLNYRFHGKLIEKEENITKIGNKYLDIFNEYDKDFLTFTLEHIESSKAHENALGNLYTDYLRHMSGVDIAVVNPGAFRTPLYRGNITNATIHSFDPFGNDIVKFKAYGWEIKKMFQQLQKGSKGFYPVSGLKMTVRNIPTRKLLSIKLYDGFKETEIKNNQLYTLASNDFCFPLEPDEEGGDDFKKVYQWFRPREAKYVIVGRYNSTRDTLIEYLRYIDQLKSDKYYNINDQRMRIIKE